MLEKQYELAYVEWLDSHNFTNGWESLAEIAAHACSSIVRSVGWVIAETDDWLLLVAHLSNATRPDSDPFGFSDLSIPKVSIVKRVPIQIGAIEDKL